MFAVPGRGEEGGGVGQSAAAQNRRALAGQDGGRGESTARAPRRAKGRDGCERGARGCLRSEAGFDVLVKLEFHKAGVSQSGERRLIIHGS